MFLTVKRLMALSLPTHREQFEQRTNLTWPRPFLLRPPLLRFLVYKTRFSKRTQRASDGCIQSVESPSSQNSHNSRIVSQSSSRISLWRVIMVLTILN